MSRSLAVRWLASFIPAPVSVRWQERARSCLGALLGIAFTGGSMLLLLGPAANIPLLVAPMGASAVLLFAVPASPLAQPWSIIGGNLVSATIGVTCAGAIADPTLAAALAVALSIGGMFALRCVHPPSGAVALTAVLGGPAIHALGYRFVLEPIAIQSAALLAAALAYHAATGHRYPHAGRPARTATGSPAGETSRAGFTRADLEAVLKRRGEMLDIDPDDLESLLRETELQAFSRSFNELRCEDIMSRNVVSVSAGTRATAAWALLKRNKVKALPVTDSERNLIGIVTRTDLVDKRIFGKFTPFVAYLDGWLRGDALRAPTAGGVMTTEVRTIEATAPITDLVPIFANHGHHHIPVLDAAGHMVGMITQVDLISGLYQQTLIKAHQIA
ncbi:HPP family protein [Paraburkholderia sp. BL21I4N1]|uniref:HPP family protein n=1 Tax=Paraburkholderia sp. BL21I4N1 TaxID=1938801 RepID=UPI000D435E81|nr:HPP family protein [Paraburkholderia sp. BL21I4N1]PQV53140.1 CBS domain-containing membrane protein [Paraburkholderia sp. BL21I4N1]